MIRPLPLLPCLACLPGPALAQSPPGATAPHSDGLDLSVPQPPLPYPNDPTYTQDPSPQERRVGSECTSRRTRSL